MEDENSFMAKRTFLLVKSFMVIAFKRETAYRATFLSGIIGQWISYGATFISLYILATNFGQVDGWNGSEIMVLYSMSLLSYSIGGIFLFNFSTGLSRRIRSGEFDDSLTKPIPPLAHAILSSGFNVCYISHISISIMVFVFSLISLNYSMSFVNCVFIIFAILSGAMIQAAAFIASSTMAFFTVGNNPLIDFIMYDVKEFTNYPLGIFPKGIQYILTFILPFAMMNFYPASTLLNKSLPEGFPTFLPYLSPIIGLIALSLSVFLWNWGLSHYKSTGS
ncbi:hypothetical protein D5270_11700 [Acutalibacter sp. 1XD8-36]|nr:hypothetical protein [Acutalibacter sp. 1XD8-36]